MYWKMQVVVLMQTILGMVSSMFSGMLNPIESIIRDMANSTLDRYSLNQTQENISYLWGFVNSCYLIGLTSGSVLLPFCCEKFGRKGTAMLLNMALVVAASILGFLSKLTDLFELLILSRLIGGCTDALNVNILFMMECGSARTGKFACGIGRLGDVTWYTVSGLVGLPQLLGTEQLWQFIMLIPTVPALLFAACAIFVPESPKHLIITLQDEQRGIEAIRFFNGPNVHVQEIIDEMRLEAAHSHQASSICHVLSVRHLRLPFFICIIAYLCSRTMGFDIDNFYSVQLMVDIGLSVESATLIHLLVLRLPMIFLSLLFFIIVNRVSTRSAFLLTLFGGCVGLTLMCVSEGTNQFWPTSPISAPLFVCAICIQMVAFQLGAAFYPKILPAEICLQAIRSLTSGYGAALASLVSVLLTFSFPPLGEVVGWMWAFVPLVVTSWVLFIWLWFYLPDTENRTVNQIVEKWYCDQQNDDHELQALL